MLVLIFPHYYYKILFFNKYFYLFKPNKKLLTKNGLKN